jgi:hypothetical protein
VKGLVIPSDWDDYGDIVRISIATSNENEYLVRKNKNENILRQRLGKSVVVCGVISEEDNREIIIVYSLFD